jgi:arylsulfatase A-like enzyme
MNGSKRLPSGWLPAFGLAFLLMLVSFAELLPQFGFIFHGDKVLDSVIDSSLLGTRLGNQITWFLVAQLLLYSLYAVFLWAVSHATLRVFPQAFAKSSKPGYALRTIIMAWFLASVMAILGSSAARYPWSVAGEFYGRFVAQGTPGNPVVRVFSIMVLAAAIGISLAAVVKAVRPRMLYTRRRPLLATSGAIVLMLAVVAWTRPHAFSADAVPDRPHVVLIGIDSLRREATTIAGDGKLTPNISAFLSQSQVFKDATTPLARTFPSWISILTGRHPRETGAVVNLIDDKNIHASPTLPDVLRNNRYQTIFGMDEVRFANIDSAFGFDQVITPPMGASDFLLATINDTPLGNLIVNTALGRWLFPNSYANRAAAMVYDPNVFSARIRNEVDMSKPTFLAVHLTLPHWPYIWSNAPAHDVERADWMQLKYNDAVRRADEQFADVMAFLEARGVLRNAIVIVLSDHGESLNLPGDCLLPVEQRYIAQGAVTPLGMTGHGTSILSPPQFTVVLGMRGFGAAPLAQQPARVIEQPVSLEDIAPTVLDLLKLQRPAAKFDGWSLAALLLDEPNAADGFAMRVRFSETEFNPPQLQAGANSERAVAAKNAKYYHVDPASGRLKIREDRLKALLAGRQFAAISQHRLLAAFPSGGKRDYKFLLIDRSGENMQLFDAPPATVGDAETQALWQGMNFRFGSAIDADFSPLPSTTLSADMSARSNQN